LPGTLNEYIDFSMAAQAEGLKFGIEHFRRRKPHCSGTLLWQLNDCWPVLSWSVIDYYGFGKAGYYYAKRVYAPYSRRSRIAGWGTRSLGDKRYDARGQGALALQLVTFAGEVLWHESVEARIAANNSVEVWRGSLQRGNNHYLAVSGSQYVAGNRLFFAAIKDLSLPRATIAVTARQVDNHTVKVELKADKFAYFVRLSTGLETSKFSDNYIDLEQITSELSP